ncbi:gag protease polyprotein [Cucumis melo var. makuwa]|uniref:Gag protease polyprotein n=1 Tax=Cucumis melo var. makuwa TaxID=1194695 RepID=A0A5A7V5A4_CUCMM|nr:gag protease polyprotein [Cucumis melo var. makuwa]TYK27448.1 gag protease polyprotein [Cucumis melo var. makuwa]
MTVEQYDAEFDMLCRFVPEMIATEAARADKFVRGLRLDIQGWFEPSDPSLMPIHCAWQWISVYRRGLTRPRLQVEVQPQDRKGRLSSSLFQCHSETSDQVVSLAVSSRNLLRQRKLPEGSRCVPLAGSTIWAVVYLGPRLASSVGKRGIPLTDAR